MGTRRTQWLRWGMRWSSLTIENWVNKLVGLSCSLKRLPPGVFLCWSLTVVQRFCQCQTFISFSICTAQMTTLLAKKRWLMGEWWIKGALITTPPTPPPRQPIWTAPRRSNLFVSISFCVFTTWPPPLTALSVVHVFLYSITCRKVHHCPWLTDAHCHLLPHRNDEWWETNWCRLLPPS